MLDALRERLREFDPVPIVFDFDKPTRRDLTETVQLLANTSASGGLGVALGVAFGTAFGAALARKKSKD